MVSMTPSVSHFTTADRTEQHTLIQSVFLHLVPGLLGTLLYVLAAPSLRRLGFPPLFAIYLIIPVIVAIELGYLLYQGKQRNGRLSLHGIVLYRASLPRWQYAVFVPALLIWAVLASGLIAPLETFFAQTLFGWLPEAYMFSDLSRYADQYSRSILLITLGVGIALNGIAAPIVEELYFRGYLLPRLTQFGRAAPIANAVLFSLYHFWTPWQFVSRILVVLPWAYLAWRKHNLSVGIVVHCLLNVLGTLLTFALILR